MSQLRRYPDEIIDVRIDHPISIASRDPIPASASASDRHALAVDDGRRYPPQPTQDQTSKRLSHSSDSSVPLFTLYLRISEEPDRRKYEHLKGEIDLILVFVSHCVGYHPATSPFTREL
jgi:hypothetical protein